jgi:hypothetical protein
MAEGEPGANEGVCWKVREGVFLEGRLVVVRE